MEPKARETTYELKSRLKAQEFVLLFPFQFGKVLLIALQVSLTPFPI